jgi:chorismate synthase
MKGSVHNEPFYVPETLSEEETSRLTGGLPKSKLQTRTNHSGGIQGGVQGGIQSGIPNGMPIVFRVAFKPPATISQDQTTAKYDGTGEGVLVAKGRHDPFVVPRAVPIVGAMAALTIADAVMLQHSRQMGRSMMQ